MPTVSVYIRKEDFDRWNTLESKTEWISQHLNSQEISFGNTSKKQNFEKLKEEFVPRPPDPKTGYPCCQDIKPCKHWQWDGNTSSWLNQLTGKTREAAI